MATGPSALSPNDETQNSDENIEPNERWSNGVQGSGRPLSTEALDATLGRLRQTFASGRTCPIEWRLEQLEQLDRLLAENAERIAEVLRADLGKPDLETFTTEISVARAEVATAIKNLKAWTKPEKVATPAGHRPAKSRIVYEPYGLVLIIAPWNYPVSLVFNPLVGAIAAGNTTVIKPSEIASTTSELLAELIPSYLDTEATAVVEGGVETTSALLAENFDYIFFTGSTLVGRIVMEAAAKTLTPVTLELGGKSPCIVAADSNLKLAARRIAFGKFMNCGQSCTAPDYILVERSAEEGLITALQKTITKFFGTEPKASPDFGRIINEDHTRRLASLLAGSEIVCGGDVDERERYVAPTVLRNVDPNAAVMSEEIFGPILPVIAVDSIDGAIDFVNERDKPLALYVFSNDTDTTDRVLARTSAGGVCVNATMWHVANPNLPFGGVGPSGVGAYHGRYSFETFSHRKAICEKSTRVDPRIPYPPYGAIKKWLIKKAV